MSLEINSISKLPIDSINEVRSYLPKEEQKQARLVCKRWCYPIDSFPRICSQTMLSKDQLLSAKEVLNCVRRSADELDCIVRELSQERLSGVTKDVLAPANKDVSIVWDSMIRRIAAALSMKYIAVEMSRGAIDQERMSALKRLVQKSYFEVIHDMVSLYAQRLQWMGTPDAKTASDRYRMEWLNALKAPERIHVRSNPAIIRCLITHKRFDVLDMKRCSWVADDVDLMRQLIQQCPLTWFPFVSDRLLEMHPALVTEVLALSSGAAFGYKQQVKQIVTERLGPLFWNHKALVLACLNAGMSSMYYTMTDEALLRDPEILAAKAKAQK